VSEDGAPGYLVRAERDDDHAAVHAVNAAAFESPVEAELVDKLRREADPVVSLVAEAGGKIVGHIMFTPVTLPGHPDLRMMGLAPMAVAAAHRGQGIGSALVRNGIDRCARMEMGAVVVLGHPGYYPRFGFRPGAGYGLACEYDAPADSFMVKELQPGYLAGRSGKVSYHAAFAGE
jgi:putative acetyltransferase